MLQRRVTRGWPRFGRFRQFAKFAVIGGIGVVITNAVYDLLNIHFGSGPVVSATLATVAAAIFTYLGNRYWSFRGRQRTGIVREAVIFAVLNGLGLLIQDATVALLPAVQLARAKSRHAARPRPAPWLTRQIVHSHGVLTCGRGCR